MAESSLEKLSLDDTPFGLVAAIDFGTTYSGYAFGFTASPKDIHINKNWGVGMGFQSYKTPTSVLTGPDHKFLAFGHSAEQQYSKLKQGSGAHYLYRHFKMILHQQQHLTRSTKVTSTNGHIRLAMDIFVMAIEYLKNHLLKAISEGSEIKVEEGMIRWVITVPAIWSDEAKSFMREAVFKAGCIKTKDSRQLVIALEPEAASIYCRSLKLNDYTVAKEVESVRFKSKTKYLVIDAGGGTVDISAHEVQFDGNLKELHLANGGSWGGTKVDENFVNLLKKILGADFINAYKQQCPENWLTMIESFGTLKKAFTPDGESELCMPLVWSIASKFRDICKRSIEDVLNNSSHYGISFSNGSIILNHNATMSLFQPVIDKIIPHVQNLLKLPALKPLSYILLVGGFGESPVLQKALQNITPSRTKFLVPSEAQLSVIKGAVLFGQNINQIISRKARKTYGYANAVSFVSGIHDESHKFTSDYDTEYCDDIFLSMIRKGDSIDIGKVITQRATPVYKHQTAVAFKIYSTDYEELDEIEYVDNSKFKKMGTVTVRSPNVEKGTDRNLEMQLKFGFTEILATAIDKSSGLTAETTFDLL